MNDRKNQPAEPHYHQTEAARPVELSERIAALDVLRGFALLGILVPNIQAFSMPSIAYRNPTVYGDLTGANYLVWCVTNLFFEAKFMTLFSVMFGAGIVLMTTRAARAGARPKGLHYRRMGWLLVFGLAHAHLLWFGDILVCYAVAGSVAYMFRRMKPSKLIVIGLLTLSVGSLVNVFFGLSLPSWPEAQIAEFREEWQPSPETIQSELDAYRGSWLDQMPKRSTEAFFFETFLLLILMFWRAGGLMLTGMALFKLGIVTGQRSNRFYIIGAVGGLLMGLPLVALELRENVSRNFAIEYSFFLGYQVNYWASLFISFAYMSIIMLVCRSGVLQWLQTALAAVGRMALTNYIGHSVICTTIFYGHGLGYFGYLERTEQLAVVLTIWLLQLIVSPIWLKYFKFGPLEWLWRSLVYQRKQPLKLPRYGS